MDPKQQAKSFLMATMAIAEAVRELGSVPNGHLYARLCDKIDIQTYNRIICKLVSAKLVENRYDLLTWIGGGVK